ncbi:MAG TPA: hypothetical protein VGK61_10285 [Planctomycetota bacterium]|jgi:hypothetical protein
MRWTLLFLSALLVQDPKPADFLTLKEGAVWTYVTGGSEGKVKVTGREKIGEVETFILTTEIDGTATEKEYVAVDATGIRMLRQASGDRLTDYAQPFVRLKLPPVKGDKWEWKGEIGKEKATASFTNEGEEEVKVPAGTYKAWKVTVTIEQGAAKQTGTNWFAPGVGIVRQQARFESEGRKHESVIELKSFEPGK